MSTTAVDRSTRAVHVRPPPRWRVVLHNDDYTPFDFVVDLLMRRYAKSEPEALRIAMNVHHTGFGVAGTFTKEIAVQKVIDTSNIARAHGYPLLVEAEQDS
ncbi:MAG TPA: ATP-dependent Clp protease adaptor ClpS [Burkholderiaceae bacterium]|jgi:ATP-dependent Clp protease adaptor protein ClpS|nr:ATP-dependent Clp protease adaptor ClpS [Burkholderiaceae bacterium]